MLPSKLGNDGMVEWWNGGMVGSGIGELPECQKSISSGLKNEACKFQLQVL